MKCPRCQNEITESMKFCGSCGAPVSPPQELTVLSDRPASPPLPPVPQSYPAPEKKQPGAGKNKKLTAALIALVAVLIILGIVIAIIAIAGGNGKKPLSEEELRQAKEDFLPPAELYDVDTSAADPSNSNIRFTFDDRARIISCLYEANGREYTLAYTYDDEKQEVVIVTTYEDTEITETTVSYDELTYYDTVEEVDGYYIRLDEDSSDKLVRAKTGFDFGQHVVEYNGVVYYADQSGLWVNDGESKQLYKGKAKNLATDGKLIYFGLFNEEKSGYSQNAGTRLKWNQFDLYVYDLSDDSCEKVTSFNECGQPICRIDNVLYYTDYEDDYDGFAVELSHSLYSYDLDSGEKTLLVEKRAHLLALYQHKIFFRRLVGAIGMNIANLECYDIDADSTQMICDGDVIDFKVAGDDLYYQTTAVSGTSQEYAVYRYDIADQSTSEILDSRSVYYDDKFVFYNRESVTDSKTISRYDIENDKTETITGERVLSGPVMRDPVNRMTVCNCSELMMILYDDETEFSRSVPCHDIGNLTAVYHNNAYLLTGDNFYFMDIKVIPLSEKQDEDKDRDTDTEAPEDNAAEEVFSELPESFVFSSGAGFWGTVLTVHPDGSFEGNYHDTNMGETGDDHPNGTRYECDFTGKFTDVKKINDYTYSMKMTDLSYEHEAGDEEIIDGVRVIYADAAGVYGGETFYIYTPDAPMDELPEEFLSWMHLSANIDRSQPFGYYGIYNYDKEMGFRG